MEIIDIEDERTAEADAALALLEGTFAVQDRHRSDDLKLEIGEKRLGLIAPYNFHLLAARDPDGIAGIAMGNYLAGVNAGFVAYLAVAEARRGHALGRRLRRQLVERFRADAGATDAGDLAFVLGEVSRSNAWLQRLVKSRGAIPFDLAYYHPGMRPGTGAEPYVLYRQPISDDRTELPAPFVRRLLYAIYHRAYRVRFPVNHPGFTDMLEQLEGRETVGPHPDFDYPDRHGETPRRRA